MATFSDIGLSQPAASTITMRIGTVTLNRNSTVAHQELLTLAGAESSLEIARVVAAVPASTEYGLVVRVASGPSSAADAVFRVNQGVGNSTAGDAWAVRPPSTLWASSAGFHFDSSGALNVNLAAAGASTVMTLAVPASWVTTAQSTVGQTTTTTIISSAATVPYIAAFTATSTELGPIVCGFYKGSTLLWPFTLWSEGGMANAAQAVGPTSFLFKGGANRPISLNIISGSTGTIHLGVTYKQE